MTEQMGTVFSNQAGITARVCPRGHVSLQVGHTCLTLRKQDFLNLAHLVQTTERRLRETLRSQPRPHEQSH
jgi:hypothetical protein